MPPRRSRRADSEEEATPASTQTQRRRRRDDTPEDEDVDNMQDAIEQAQGSGSVDQLAKGLVRYALSCEHSRKPIKRQDINEKVLGSYTRLFKDVFAQANSQLVDIFGMQFVELPKAEKVTLRQKRAVAASDSQNKTSSIWVLQTVLPDQYRMPEILGPSRPRQEDINREDAYVGLYTMAIALVTISGGMIPEGKLDRALRRMNADQSTPLGTKDKTLSNMVKDGYIVKVKDASSGGEETVDYIVGPRGKVEVGRDGVAQFIRLMFGDSEQLDELDKRIERTLQVASAHSSAAPTVEMALGASQAAGRKRGGRGMKPTSSLVDEL